MDCIAKVVVFHCYMVPTIHMQGEHSLLYYHAEVSLQKDIGTTLLSYYSKYYDFSPKQESKPGPVGPAKNN